MPYTKTIVVLANSRKPGGRCVAGKEVVGNGYGGWIRPVSTRPTAEISLDERRYENAGDPQILDIVQIQMIGAVPRVHQTENHMIDSGVYWSRTGAIGWNDLAGLADRPATLWINGDGTYHGTNDRLSQGLAPQLQNSLLLIQPDAVNIQVQTEERYPHTCHHSEPKGALHSDSGRIEWFRKQVRNSVREHDHQVIVMTCRLSDYAVPDEALGQRGEPSPDGTSLRIVNILDVVQRVRA